MPAVLLVGPRAVGKTTTARRQANAVVRLDRTAEAAAFHADPDAALRELDSPVLLDEWQAVPGVLGAVKRAVDDEAPPGSFLLTGSSRADIDTVTWPGTGRVVRLVMYGLTRRELAGALKGVSFIERAASGDAESLAMVTGDPPDLPEYVRLALAGGGSRCRPATRSRTA